MKKTLFLLLIVAMFAFVGCAESDQEATDAEVDTEVDEEVEESSGPIPFSEVNNDILSASDDYRDIAFKDGFGDCLDQGLWEEFAYVDSEVKSADGTYTEDFASVDFLGNLSFDEVPLDGGAADCNAVTEAGLDDAIVECKIGGELVCDAFYTVWASN